MNLQELRQKLAGLHAQQETIVTAAMPNGKMSTEEEGQFNALQTQIADMDRLIRMAEDVHARGTALNDPADPQYVPGVVVGKDRATEQPWESWGHFLLAVQAAEGPGVEPRHWDKRLKYARPDVKAAATGIGSTPAEGGFLLEREVLTELVSKGYENSMLAPLCRKVPIGQNADGLSVNIIDETSRATGSRWGGVQGYWRGEGDTVTASKPKFARLDVPLEELMALCYATRGMLKDATQLGSIIRQAFTEEMAWLLDDAIINGTGVGKPLGLLNSSALVSQTAETNQAASTIVTTNLSKMWARLWGRSRKNAVWLINQDIEPQLDELALIVGTGVLEPRFITYGQDGVMRIKGRPVVAVEQCATLGTVGDIILADLSQYVLIEKDAIEMAESVHVRFIYDESTFRFIYRVNGKPYWTSALTPANGGSNTQSPYVALATRS